MFWIALTIAMVAVTVAAVLTGRGLRRASKIGERAPSATIVGKVVPLVVAALWFVLTLSMSVHAIPAGHVGVVYQFGAILGQIPEGLQWTAPYQDVTVASSQIQRYRFEKIEAFSRETQDVLAATTLNYSVSADAIQYLYRTIGPRWFDVLIEPRVMNFFKEETGKYESVNVAPNREKIRSVVRARLAEDLAPYSITVHDFLIDNIDFRPEFKQAIEAKQIAAQDAFVSESVSSSARTKPSRLSRSPGARPMRRVSARRDRPTPTERWQRLSPPTSSSTSRSRSWRTRSR